MRPSPRILTALAAMALVSAGAVAAVGVPSDRPASATDLPSGAVFVPMTPTRIFDTRTGGRIGAIDANGAGPAAGQVFEDSYIGDLALSADGSTLYAVDQTNFRLIVADVPSRSVVSKMRMCWKRLCSSARTLVSGRPILIIGSIVKNMPSSRTAPDPARP